MAVREIIRVSNHSGGRNTAVGRASIEPYQTPDDLNVISEYPGTLSTRAGFQQWVNKTFGNPARMNLGRYLQSPTHKWLMVRADSELWACHGDYPHDYYIQVAAGLDVTQDMFFDKMQDWLIAVDGIDVPKRWNGSVLCDAELGRVYDLYTGTARTPGAAGAMVYSGVANEYYYKLCIDYGTLGRSAAIQLAAGPAFTGTLFGATFGGAGINGSFDFTGMDVLVDKYRACGATGVSFYRTPHLPGTIWPDTDLYQFYYVGSTTTATFTDTLNDDSLGGALNSLLTRDFADFSPPPTKRIARHRNRMYYANQGLSGANTSHLWRSFQFEPTMIEGYERVQPGDGQDITGIISMGIYLAVFKQSKVFGWFGEGDEDFELRPFDTGLGCIAPKTIAIGRLSPSGPDGCFFLSEEGVAFLSGNSVDVISADIRPDLVRMGVDRSRLVNACGAFIQGRYYLGIP